MLLIRRYSILVFLICFSSFFIQAKAQCTNRFPYTEDFQNSNGGWKTGGTATDWAWGVPQKSVIFTAGNTNKCWIAGGLTGNYYNDNEKSWLQSPCFDFSGLQNPYISFQLNWDTEKGYDGAGLQYSVDGGISWESAGAYGDPATGCASNHWFNNSYISYGFQAEGWSGSNSNGGSLGWVKAYHSFPQLAGKPNVIFRFVFGAGKVMNNFNGFAVDDIYISETVTAQLSFNYICQPSPKTVSFTAPDNGCIIASTLQWDFDDISSGTSNAGSGNSVQHVFSSPGSYSVTVTGKDNQNQVLASIQTITIPDVSAKLALPVLCNGGTGSLEASVLNTSANASYTWSTIPAATTALVQAKAGSYTVTASVEGGCSNSYTITLAEPEAFSHALQTKPADCNNLNGAISFTESGGTKPYRYSWQGSQRTTSSADNLSSGNYNITITDGNVCTDQINVTLPITASTLSQSITTTIPDCGLSNGKIQIDASGGNAGYTYDWLPNVSSEKEAVNIPSGNYTIVVTDRDFCRDTTKIALLSKPLSVSLGNDTVICKGQTLLLKPAGNFITYLWNDGSSLPSKSAGKEGNYSVTVTNAGGCIARDTIHIADGCGDLVFPSSFTPNGDGLNEQFGPTGGLSLVSSYRLLLYNRFGNLVYQSANPYQKWSGDTKGIRLTGTYTYIATYTYGGERKLKKGTIVLFL